MSHFNTEKYSIYDHWVDNLIEKHKKKLDNLKSNRTFEPNIKSRNYNATNKSMNYTYNKILRNNFQDFSIKKDNDLNFSVNSNKIEKLLDSLMEENSQLKLRLQEYEKIIEKMKNKENEWKNKTDIFVEREKDFIKTLKMIDYANKRLEKRVNELKIELNNKNKEFDLAITSDSFRVSNRIQGYFQERTPTTQIKISEEEFLIMCLKYDKLIEIFLCFFQKYEVMHPIKELVKNFDYDGIKIKLREFENRISINKIDQVAVLGNTTPKNDQFMTNLSQNKNSSPNIKEKEDISGTSYLNQSFSKKEYFSQNDKQHYQTINTSIGMSDSDVLLKIDRRLKDLEENVNSMISNQENKSTFSSKNKTNQILLNPKVNVKKTPVYQNEKIKK